MHKNFFLAAIIVVGIIVSASFLASSHPDGLEWVAERLGFIEVATETPGLMPDYVLPGMGDGALATTAAGIIGAIVCFGLFWGTSKLFFKKKGA